MKKKLRDYMYGDVSPELVTSVPFCAKCDPTKSANTMAPTIEGVFKCTNCGNEYDVPTGKYIMQKGGFDNKLDVPNPNHFYGKEDIYQRIALLEQRLTKLENSQNPVLNLEI